MDDDEEENEDDNVEMETIGGIRLTEEAQNIFNQVYRQTQEVGYLFILKIFYFI